MYRYDSNLGFVENYVSIFPREMQDGIFFRNAYNFDSQKYEAGYYNERLERVIAVDLYPDNQVYCSPFSGGLAVMEITGADGNMYITMIDAAGKQMFEPVVAEDYYPRVLDGYVIAKKDGELWLMDQTGSFVHNLTADFPECEVSVEMMHGGYSGSSTFGDDFSEGWFVLDYRYDGSSYRRFYPVVKAAEAGAEIYDLGVLTPAPVEAVTEYEEPEETVEKNYVRMDNFVIEGKWKSVGSYGFGQAQPGAIVIFNGNNCNFFSPQDTYAFYQDGDNYRLDTTSFLSTDTLSFTVKTIDADHIDVYYGDNVTELERVG